MTPTELKIKLTQDASTGLDMSPGDPVAKEALRYILALELALKPFARAYYVMGEFKCERWRAQCGSKELLGEDLRLAYMITRDK
jgi:hypothetical protein